MERKTENLAKLVNRSAEYQAAFEANWDFLMSVLISNYEKVTPKFTRKLEILEAMMFGFLESTNEPQQLEFAEKMIYGGIIN